ncbi:MAG: ABC transporter ATP-binding protein, partial [Flavobacteriales bacterium]
EPFSGISPIDTELVVNQINNQKKEKGIIYTDHNYNKVIDNCDRFYLLYNGICKEINNLKDLEFYNYLPKGRLD